MIGLTTHENNSAVIGSKSFQVALQVSCCFDCVCLIGWAWIWEMKSWFTAHILVVWFLFCDLGERYQVFVSQSSQVQVMPKVTGTKSKAEIKVFFCYVKCQICILPVTSSLCKHHPPKIKWSKCSNVDITEAAAFVQLPLCFASCEPSAGSSSMH